MKKLLFLNLILFVVLLFSCNNNKTNQINVSSQNSELYNKVDTVVLATDYLFNKLDNSENQFIFSLSFRNQNAIFSYKDKNSSSQGTVFSANYIKKGDTIFLKNWDILSKNFLVYHQVPTQFLLLQNGNLKVLKNNGSKNNEDSVVIEKDGEVVLYSARKTIICQNSDILKASTYDSMMFYRDKYVFKKDEFKYESPCSDMDSYYLGISCARDQLGGGLVADCDYLYRIAITQRENVNHYCFCKGVCIALHLLAST